MGVGVRAGIRLKVSPTLDNGSALGTGTATRYQERYSEYAKEQGSHVPSASSKTCVGNYATLSMLPGLQVSHRRALGLMISLTDLVLLLIWASKPPPSSNMATN